MTDADALYDVRERTGNPIHAPVDDVCDLLLSRAEDPRAGHQDAYLIRPWRRSLTSMGKRRSNR